VSPERFIRELRGRLALSDLKLRRDPAWAARRGFHPEAWQVWDRGTSSGEPYCMFVAQSKRGLPVPLCERVLEDIVRQTAAQAHHGRTGWVDEMERMELDRVKRRKQAEERRIEEESRKAWDSLVWPTWGLNRESVNRRQRRKARETDKAIRAMGKVER
jgi:hypothetical protein